MTRRVEEIVDGLLSLQDRLFAKEEWLKEEAREGVGRVAQLLVYEAGGTYKKRLELKPNLRIVESERDPVHVVSCHVDTFLDLLNGDLSFGDAYTRGEVDFSGENYHKHAVKWARAFKRLRGYIAGLGGD